MSDRPTPRCNREHSIVASVEFARDLERKLAEARVVIHAATVLIAAKGRHNTKLAYDGLREALARIDANSPAQMPTVGCGEKGQAP